jgi:Rps23 Pro-64 3,4-dihydroxylase Tpa1-like proline 4-hydroxylase
MQLINPIHLEKSARKSLFDEFQHGKPYKHIVVDDFLKPEIAKKLHDRFPDYEIFNRKYDGLNEKKAEGSNFEDFDPVFTQLKREINSLPFCNWISDVTGIKDVFVTDDAMGSGLHQGQNGSFLDIHIDFSMHHLDNVYRRLNLLIYFNEGWQDEWKGYIELWNADRTVLDKKVRPDFNRAVLFETTERSYHGYGKIDLPQGVTRKSFYTYFYTEDKGDQNETYNDTVFKARPEYSETKKLNTNIKEQSKNFFKHQLKRFGFKF